MTLCRAVQGLLDYLRGDYAEARIALLEALQNIEMLQDHEEITWSSDFLKLRGLLTLSRIARAEGDLHSAREYVAKALRHTRRKSITSFALAALVAMAEVLAAQAQMERAAELAALVQSHPHTYAFDKADAARLSNALGRTANSDPTEQSKAFDVWPVVEALSHESAQSGA